MKERMEEEMQELNAFIEKEFGIPNCLLPYESRAAAFELLGKMVERLNGYELQIDGGPGNYSVRTGDRSGRATAPTLPLALCLLAKQIFQERNP